MKAKLVMTFSKHSEAGFVAISQAIKAALNSTEGLALYPSPWGDVAKDPQRTDLNAAVDAHEPLYTQALNGGKSQIIARNDSRAALTAMFQAVAPFLEDMADYDAEKLSKSGFELRKTPTAPITGTLPGPQGLKLKTGNASGIILVTVAKLAGAGSYDVWTCTGDPNVEANWRQAALSKSCRSIEVSGLTAGTKYYVRVRGIGKAPGGWSNIESIIAI